MLRYRSLVDDNATKIGPSSTLHDNGVVNPSGGMGPQNVVEPLPDFSPFPTFNPSYLTNHEALENTLSPDKAAAFSNGRSFNMAGADSFCDAVIIAKSR